MGVGAGEVDRYASAVRDGALHYASYMLKPIAFPLSLTEPLTRSLLTAEPLLMVREAEERVRMTRDLTRSLHQELWHRDDEVAIEAPGDETGDEG